MWLNEQVKREHATGFTFLRFSSVIKILGSPLLFTYLTFLKQI